MASYMKAIYPQIAVGASHTRPSLPHCCISIREVSVTWDINSSNDDDRAEYWEVDISKHDPAINAPLMSALEVETAVYGAAGKDQWIIDNPGPVV